MNVLLLHNDLYHTVGGGQTVYRRLIETNPGITFFYLGVKESSSAARPSNAELVPFKEAYATGPLGSEFSGLDFPPWAFGDFLEASNIAASIAHLQMDVVDVPDYCYYAYLLGPALRHHGQKKCRVVLAMHGNLSETQRVAWGHRAGAEVTFDQREQWQYRVADSRYAISRDYLEQWSALTGVAANYVHPLRFLAPPAPKKATGANPKVGLQFIGRTEAFKGPDYFVELVASLPAGSYRSARVIGPSTRDAAGIPSDVYLKGLAERRSVTIDFHPGMNRTELAQLFADRTVTVLPSRMDTLNLTAIESIFAGCPIAVSRQAGVCRFLRDTFPQVPFATIDVGRLYSGAAVLQDLIVRYDDHRTELVDVLGNATFDLTGASLGEVYDSRSESDRWLARQAERTYQSLLQFQLRQRSSGHQRIARVAMRVCEAARTFTENAKASAGEHEGLWWLYRKLFYAPESFPDQIDRKVEFCASLSTNLRVDRARTWAEQARLERVRGNDFVAATLDIRVMRALGGDRLGQLPQVMATLQEAGYSREAEALEALYGAPEQRLARCRALLKQSLEIHRTVPDRPFEWIRDTRSNPSPRVSIIVSLYKAANKLDAFLRMLAQLPWVADGRAELVLVDSHSPTDEHVVYEKVSAELGLKAVYARTHERETIQCAWNRGVLLARAPYLTFLGVDEMVRPDCFALLAAELDRDDSLDWVQGNSLISEVDMSGNLDRDVMMYQRIPYEQDLVYLETCYLSWVGGMYRKSIHERLGYYDESFGAAGDTEFKNRILPFIRSKTLPVTLGIFLNYPEERTTQSPRAEVEDLRAWYLHRSEAGVEYALAKREVQDALTLFDKAVGYRKSYFAHQSSDLDYASAILAFVAKRLPESGVARCAAPVERALQAYRDLEWLPELSPRAAEIQRCRTAEIAAQAGADVSRILARKVPAAWTIFNDNRYEQHSCQWLGSALTGRVPAGQRYRLSPARPIAAPFTLPVASSPGAFNVNQLLDALRARSKALPPAEADLAPDLELVAQFIQDVAADRKPSVALDGARPGSAVCRLLSENQPLAHFGNPALLNAKTGRLAALLAESLRSFCVELADACDAIAHQASQLKCMEIAARLLACKTPDEALRRYAAEINTGVITALSRGETAARAAGNHAYADRLATFVSVLEAELARRGPARAAAA